MALEIGARLGPYEIVGMLGSGGMAEVWKARDSRVDRIVAIKVSAEALTARSEREARAVAALNHPNICQLYDVGPNYLVLEYIDGLPVAPTGSVRKLLDLAVQLADGMASAHAAGFVHRDLKPSNVLVTRDGRLKILDFGLAKNVAPADGPAPTVTGAGLVAGTVAYMSPEQARGNAELDARSDQFAFGLVLYELATGKRAFERPTGVETLMAIMRDEAEPLPATLPAPLRWIIERCLAKEPEQRYESSRDLYLELKSLREHLTDASATRPAIENVAARSSRRATFLLAGGIAAGAVVTLLTMLLAGSRELPTPQLRFKPLSFEQGGQVFPVWSPDGRAVAYTVLRRGTDPQEIDVRYLDSPVASTLTALGAGVAAAFPRQWTSKGEILFAGANGLWSISAVGGKPELVLADPEGTNSIPQTHAITRDGSTAATFLQAKDGEWSVWISSPFGSPFEKYEPSPFAAREIFDAPVLEFSPDGKQLLLKLSRGLGEGEELWLLPLGTHAPRRLLLSQSNTSTLSWLPNSRHIVAAKTGDLARSLYVVDTVSGKTRLLSSGITDQGLPSVSPDGRKLAFVEQRANFDIVALDLASAAITPVIATDRIEGMPAWAENVPSLAYVTNRNGGFEIWLHEPGRRDRPLVTGQDFPTSTEMFLLPALSPDGKRVIFARVEAGGASSILWMASVEGGAPQQLVPASNSTSQMPGSWAADGNSFVYPSSENGSWTLYTVKATGHAQPEVVAADLAASNTAPVWSPSGEWILLQGGGTKLLSPDGKIVRDLKIGGALCAFAQDGSRLYCILAPSAPDGSRALAVVNLEGGIEHVIGTIPAESAPAAFAGPGLRLTLAPDGKSVYYSTANVSRNLWLLEGLETVPLP